MAEQKRTIETIKVAGYLAVALGLIGGVGGLFITWMQNRDRVPPAPWPNVPTAITVVAFLLMAAGGLAFARRRSWGRIAMVVFSILFSGGQAVAAFGFGISTIVTRSRIEDAVTVVFRVGTGVISIALGAGLALATALLVRWLVSERIVSACRDNSRPDIPHEAGERPER
ncbi:MAG: MprA protease, GlyGly-CTERM protein-sorting domain-containing form [Armatimonadia bacterium]|nr:MprA protease, GlyGly-CTERM protein-sorting domain-containing form [Armatimonadia bacterium]